MKRVNTKSLLQAKDTLSAENFKIFLKHYDIEIRDAEIEDLRVLVKALSDAGCNTQALDHFYIGYKIPQIGKEFDLLRFGRDYILNIELKSTCTEEKIKKQLLRNKYYMGFLARKSYFFTYVSKSQQLYFLQDDGNLQIVHISFLVESLARQIINDTELPNSLFNPSDYLVSPFNSTKRFLSDEYFLTKQQEEIKDQIISALQTATIAKFISIIGSAGTGKTLLTYDIAKYLIAQKKRPLIIHCGQLNSGHIELSKNGWIISPIKGYSYHNLENYDLVIVDEAQRIYPAQLDSIVEKARLAKCCCIFSYDKLQTLSDWEKSRNMGATISTISGITIYQLSEKIRTNKEIAAFIKMVFNNKRSLPISNRENIEINYFGTNEDAKRYLETLDENKWEILNFTPSQYGEEYHKRYSKAAKSTAHQVIGQEFDGVAVTIDSFFTYAADGDLIYNGRTYYNIPKMLFQNITRARKKLNLVIINNAELLIRCIAILQSPT